MRRTLFTASLGVLVGGAILLAPSLARSTPSTLTAAEQKGGTYKGRTVQGHPISISLRGDRVWRVAFELDFSDEGCEGEVSVRQMKRRGTKIFDTDKVDNAFLFEINRTDYEYFVYGVFKGTRITRGAIDYFYKNRAICPAGAREVVKFRARWAHR